MQWLKYIGGKSVIYKKKVIQNDFVFLKFYNKKKEEENSTHH